MKKILVISAVAVAMASGIALAETKCTGQKTGMPAVTFMPDTKAVEAGNTVCPVMGTKIDEKTKATYTYEGKVYNFCCESCIEEFKKDPAKYIKALEEKK